MKKLEWMGLGFVLAALTWALGCGGDDTTSPPKVSVIEVRNGTWHIVETSTFSGADSCLARSPQGVDTTDVICRLDLVSGNSDFPVTCNISTIGDQLTFDCRGRVDLGICWHNAYVAGSGTVTDTTFDIDFTLYQNVTTKDPDNAEACQLLYGRFVDACTTAVNAVGTWVDTTGADTCPDDTLSKGGFLSIFQ